MDESPYTAEDRQRWRGLLLAKGQELASALEAILAKKDVRLDDFDLVFRSDVKETPERRLRRYFDQVMAQLRRVDAPDFGYDAAAEAFVDKAVLDERPWVDLSPQ